MLDGLVQVTVPGADESEVDVDMAVRIGALEELTAEQQREPADGDEQLPVLGQGQPSL